MVTRQTPLQPQQPPSASPSVRGANQEPAERQKFSALLKMLRAGLM
jgi:hypothetical protein